MILVDGSRFLVNDGANFGGIRIIFDGKQIIFRCYGELFWWLIVINWSTMVPILVNDEFIFSGK